MATGILSFMLGLTRLGKRPGQMSMLPATSAPAVSTAPEVVSHPSELGPVNTTELEFANGISKDGLSFYFQRGTASSNGEDIWVVHRPSADEDWGEPQKLSDTVNSSFNDRAAFVSPNGHWLWNRPAMGPCASIGRQV